MGTAAITSGSSYVANDFVIPDYIFNSTNSCFYKIISTNSDALKSSKATLTGTLTLGNNMEIIGPYTFNQQSSLTGELFIPNSVQTIGDSAFYDCTGLTFGPDSTSEIKYTSVNATHAHK